MRISFIASILASAAFVVGCGGSNPEPNPPPTATAADGTKVPLPTENGELKDGKTTVKTEGPDGEEKKTEVKVDK